MKTWTCPRCKRPFPYDQPILIDGCVGHATPIHECGNGFVAVTLRPRSKSARSFWGAVARWIKGADA